MICDVLVLVNHALSLLIGQWDAYMTREIRPAVQSTKVFQCRPDLTSTNSKKVGWLNNKVVAVVAVEICHKN